MILQHRDEISDAFGVVVFSDAVVHTVKTGQVTGAEGKGSIEEDRMRECALRDQRAKLTSGVGHIELMMRMA